MGCINKIGTFDNEGRAVGWDIDCKGMKTGSCLQSILELTPNGNVLIGGVLMVELTQERKQKMGMESMATFFNCISHHNSLYSLNKEVENSMRG